MTWTQPDVRRTAGIACVALGLAAFVALALPVLTAGLDPAWVWPMVAGFVALAVAWRHPFGVAVVLAAWWPIETVALSRLPIGGSGYTAMQLAGEAWLYAGLGAVVLKHVWMRRALPRTPADWPVVMLLGWIAVSTVVNEAPLAGSVMNTRSLLRFAAAFYLVAYCRPTTHQAKWMLGVLLGSAVLQAGLAVAQKYVPGGWEVWLLPRDTEGGRRFALLGRGREVGSVFGTLGDTVYLGVFAVVGLAVCLAAPYRRKVWAVLLPGAMVWIAVYSYSRAALLAALALVLAVLVQRFGAARTGAWLCVGLAGLVLMSVAMDPATNPYVHPRRHEQSALANATGFLNKEYLERARQQRLGSLIGTAPTAVAHAPLTGFGMDTQHTVDQLNAVSPSYLTRVELKTGFEDVYWVALLSYVGLPGVLIWAWLWLELGRGSYRRAVQTHDVTLRWAGHAAWLVVLGGVILMWFVRAPEFRAYGFYLWVLPALACSMRPQKMASV